MFLGKERKGERKGEGGRKGRKGREGGKKGEGGREGLKSFITSWHTYHMMAHCSIPIMYQDQ